MNAKRVAVMGAGHGGYAMAADLTLAGYEISLYEMPQFSQNILPIIERGGIELTGIASEGFARISRVTKDIGEALNGAHIIIVATQSLGHEMLAELCAPYMVDGQTIVIMPGNFGSIVFSRILREKGVRKEIRIAETMTFPYAARRIIGEAKVHISHLLPLNMAAFPACNTTAVLDTVKELYPEQFRPARNVLEVALSNPNCFHLPICIMNTAVIEKSSGDFYPYSQGASPSVIGVIEAVWRERDAVLNRLGLSDLHPFEKHKEFFKNLTSVQAVITGPTNMQHRMIIEDCPYVLVPLASVGEMIGVPTPVSKALITLASVINGADYFNEGRNVDRLGISGKNVDQLNDFFA